MEVLLSLVGEKKCAGSSRVVDVVSNEQYVLEASDNRQRSSELTPGDSEGGARTSAYFGSRTLPYGRRAPVNFQIWVAPPLPCSLSAVPCPLPLVPSRFPTVDLFPTALAPHLAFHYPNPPPFVTRARFILTYFSSPTSPTTLVDRHRIVARLATRWSIHACKLQPALGDYVHVLGPIRCHQDSHCVPWR